MSEYISIVVKGADGAAVAAMTAYKKQFSTGSRGFHVSDKIVIDGKRYQANVQLVEIGSKPQQGA